ncbi:MAG TPA: DUF1996 domain-containing protein [Acidimicrobiales bacterium]|nr:DUF1996 domain-containing protein [Acidimicrobiales bacterium]
MTRALRRPRRWRAAPARRRLGIARAAVIASLVLAAACGSQGPTGPPTGGETPGVSPVRLSPTEPGPQGRVPQFVVECGYSHSGPNDPIVHPHHTGRSHLHQFFGNDSTDADSTAETLADGGTTCDQHLDLASYWAPALLDHRAEVVPLKAVAYYRPGVGVDPAVVEPYPYGLKMLGGDQVAVEPQSLDVVAWSCGTGSERAVTPPTCPDGRPLRVAISFPDCWDGENLDSPDHVGHVARSVDGACPESHPVVMPQLLLTITYPVTGDGHDLSLASGSLLTGHADFFNAWHEDKLRTEVESCIHRGLTCGVASNRS